MRSGAQAKLASVIASNIPPRAAHPLKRRRPAGERLDQPKPRRLRLARDPVREGAER